MRRYDALMATAALLVTANSTVTVLLTQHQGLQLATTVLRLAAFAALWRTLPRAVHAPRSWLPLTSYSAGLFALFGDGGVGGINGWIWLPKCAPIADYTAADITGWVLTASSSGLILWVWCTTARDHHRPAGHPPVAISVAGTAALAAGVWWTAATILNHMTGAHRWCDALTDQVWSPLHQIAGWSLAGLNEELAFTGLGLAMLLRARRSVAAAGLIVNVFVRLSLHLYYANHQTVLLWLAWAACWSGIGLLCTLAIGRRALAHGMPLGRCVVTCTLGVAVTHSLYDLLPGPLFTSVAVVFGGCAVVLWAFPLGERPFSWICSRSPWQLVVDAFNALANLTRRRTLADQTKTDGPDGKAAPLHAGASSDGPGVPEDDSRRPTAT
ncbi:MAG: hypothetical protein WCE30_17715 [Mycobacterium sp.]